MLLDGGLTRPRAFRAAPQDTYQMGEDEEHRMCEAVIKALGDSATEVQGVAVKW